MKRLAFSSVYSIKIIKVNWVGDSRRFLLGNFHSSLPMQGGEVAILFKCLRGLIDSCLG